jgi:hypothetical protein
VKDVGSRNPDAAVVRRVRNAVIVTRSACTGSSFLWPRSSSFQRAHNYSRQKYRFESKVHPKGYVEMLERQQRLLVSAIHAMYRKQSCDESLADNPTPTTTSKHPQTHDILQELGLVPSSNHTSRPTSDPIPKAPAELSNHRNVEASELRLQSPMLRSDQDAFSDVICPTSYDSWLVLLSDHVDGFVSDAQTTSNPHQNAIGPAATHIPQASMVPTLSRPELTPQDCTVTFHDPLLYRTSWMLDEN